MAQQAPKKQHFHFLEGDPQTVNGINYSPRRLLFYLTIAVFFVELAIMLVIEFSFNDGGQTRQNLLEAIIDATILTLVIFPILYRFSQRPLLLALQKHQAAEAALSESYTLLENIFASLNDAVLVIRLQDRTIVAANVMAEKLLDTPHDILIGKSILNILNDNDKVRQAFEAELDRTQSTDRPSPIQIKTQLQKDTELTLDITATKVLGEKDMPLILLAIEDVTEKEKSEKQLRLNSAALQAAANGIMITDATGLIEWVNPALSKMTGYAPAEIIGQKANVLNSHVHDQEYFAELWATISAGQQWEGEIINQRKDGSIYTEHQAIAHLQNSNDEITHYIAIKQDITQSKITEAQLARHNQELMALDKLGQTVVFSLELEVVLEKIVSQLLTLLDAECFAIILEENNRLVHVATGGLESELMQGETVDANNNIPRQVMESGQVIHISNEPDLLKVVCSCQPHALIAAPLNLGDKVIGVIQASHSQPNKFTEDEVRILKAASNWAAIAISHARHLREVRTRLHETITLSAINQSLNEALDLDNILQLIADATPRLIPNLNRVVIHLLDEKEDMLYPAIWSGQSDMGTPTLFLDPNDGLAGLLRKNGTLVNIPNVENSPYIADGIPNQRVKSIMIAPLQSGQKQLGTISVHNQDEYYAFSASDERLLMRLAASAAVAINTANYYQTERKLRQFAEDLARAAAVLSQSLKMDAVMRNVMQQTTHILRLDKAALYLFTDKRLSRVKVSDGDQVFANLPAELSNLIRDEVIPGYPSLRLVLETGKPIVFADVGSDKNMGAYVSASPEMPFAAAPLHIGAELLGFLTVFSERGSTFNKSKLQRLEALASHATLAVQNARLYNELEDTLEKEQTTRAQLVQAQKLSAMGRLVASVAHELNNPLQTIKNCIYLTQQDLPADDPASTYLDMALSETSRLRDLVLELRDVYRPANSNEMHPLKLTAVIDQVILILKQHILENNVTLVYAPSTEPATVIGEANQLKQVLLNICLNAIEAMEMEAGQLTITLEADEDHELVGVSIRDTGPGLPMNIQQKIFEPFFTTKDEGVGLGLAICYDIIHKHGGTIAVENVADLDTTIGNDELGAIFTIWLPLANQLSATPELPIA